MARYVLSRLLETIRVQLAGQRPGSDALDSRLRGKAAE
jgi:hypothetical protein